MKVQFSLLLIILIGFSACGKKANHHSPAIRTVEINKKEIPEILKDLRFECAGIEGSKCPEGITRLFIANKNIEEDSHVCSGFMVGQDTMITNFHCIQSQAVCDNTFVAIYNVQSYVKTKCQKVLKILSDFEDSNDPRKKLDVAIVKLKDQFFGPVLKISSKKPVAYEGVSAWVIDHTGLDLTKPNKKDARLTQLACSISPSQETQAVLLENCPVIAGNSGSPVLNSIGEVVGVIYAGTLDYMDSSDDLPTRRSTGEIAAMTEAQYFSEFLSL